MTMAATTKKTKLQLLLEKHEACAESRLWAAQFKTPATAWEACQKPEWMLWAIDALGLNDDRKLRLFACWCARNTPLPDGRTTWDLLTDERSRNAVEVAERFADGNATEEELAAAGAAAWDAAWDAARAAAGAAAWDAAWDAARDAAGAAAWDAQAKQLRKIFGNPFKESHKSRTSK